MVPEQPHLYTHEEVEAWTPETIRDVPTAFLVGVLKRVGHRGGPAAWVKVLTDEAKRRGPSVIKVWWIVQALAPDRCACGGPGLYIVGGTTYCRKCKDVASTRLASAARRYREPLATAKAEAVDEQEKQMRHNEHLAAYERGMKRQPWRRK